MRLKVLLMKKEKYDGFVIEDAVFREERIVFPVRPRKGRKGRCSICGKEGPCYDHLRARQFKLPPLWGFVVVLLYRPRRMECEGCGVHVEAMPWAHGKSPLTLAMLAYLANWAKVLSWEEVARRFDVCWRNVWEAVTYVVDWGLHERSLEGIEAIGVDEIHVGPKAKFLTLVYQLDEGRRRLLYVAKDRTKAALRGFFKELPAHVAKEIRFVCSDMWRNYLDVIKEEIGHAVHVLDRFHICARLSKAIDKVRASESRALARKGYEPVLKHTRFCYLKRPRNLTQKQRTRLKDVLQYDLRTNRAYLLKEAFQGLWKYRSVVWARWFLRKWCARAMRSKLDPIKEFVKTLRAHEGLLLNWVKAKGEVHGAAVEGLNNKAKVSLRDSYGIRTHEVLKSKLFHALGELPEHPLTHRFC